MISKIFKSGDSLALRLPKELKPKEGVVSIELLRGNPSVVQQAQNCSPADLGISVITRHELLYGALRCSEKRKDEELRKN